MTPIQKILLEMVKEIDTICRNHNITYYLSGGSVIGAIRHKGFIPWDDDIDILMDRKNWKKFLQAATQSLPPGRKLECIELNQQFNNTVNKYVNTETTDIHKNELLGDSSAGIVIDIILLDLIPNNEKAFHKYLKDLELYSDLINDAYSYLLRWQFKIPYKFYNLLIKIFGRNTILNKLEQKLTQYQESNCSKYVVAWGGGPTLFDKAIFGTPRYVSFEGEKLPIPEKAYEFASIVYGYDWINVPSKKYQSTHNTILSFDYSSIDLYERFYKSHNKNDIKKLYAKHKIMTIKWAAKQNKNSYAYTLLDAYRVKTVLEKQICENNIQPADLYSEKKYEQLRNLFSEYIKKQCSKNYIGGEMWDGLIRRYNPVFIDIDDNLLYEILKLLMYDGELTKINFILRARELDKKEPLSPQIQTIKVFLHDISNIINLYDAGEFQQCLEKITSLEENYHELSIISKLKIRLWSLELKIEKKANKELVLREVIRFPEDGEFLKYYADLVYEEYGIATAYFIYGAAYKHTRNGIVWNEIFQILFSEIDWMYEYSIYLIKNGQIQDAEDIIKVWGYIPNILNTNLLYQKVYFEYQVAICETIDDLLKVVSSVSRIWANTENKTVLEQIHTSTLKKIGHLSNYPQYQIILEQNSSYSDLDRVYKQLSKLDLTTMCREERILLAVASNRTGRIGEAFKEFYQLWREMPEDKYVVNILAYDLFNQFIRMLQLKNNAAKKFFLKELSVKYPCAKELVDLLCGLGFIQSENKDLIQSAVEELLRGKNYVKNLETVSKNIFMDSNIKRLKMTC